MGIRRTDRLWLIGGLVAIVLIVTAAYLLAIKPVYTRTAEFQGQAQDSELSLVTYKKELAKRKAEFNDKAKYENDLTTMRGHLPDNYDMPDFVRALQASGIAVNVKVSGISVGGPSMVAKSEEVVSVPITLTAAGSAENLSKFINRLQQVQERAVLITSINLSSGNTPAEKSATIVLNAFCTKNSAECAAAG